MREGLQACTGLSCDSFKGQPSMDEKAGGGMGGGAKPRLNIFAHSFHFVAETTRVLRPQEWGRGGERGEGEGQRAGGGAGWHDELVVALEGDAARQPFHQVSLLACSFVRVCVCARAHRRAHARTHARMHASTHTHTHIRTHTHIHTNKQEGNGLNEGLFGPVDLANTLASLGQRHSALEGRGKAKTGEAEAEPSGGGAGAEALLGERRMLGEALTELMVEDSLRRAVSEVRSMRQHAFCAHATVRLLCGDGGCTYLRTFAKIKC